MKLAICVPSQTRKHTDSCNDCLRRADSRKTEKAPWQWVPAFKGECPSKVIGEQK